MLIDIRYLARLNTKILSGVLPLLLICGLFLDQGYAGELTRPEQRSGYNGIFSFFQNLWEKQNFLTNHKNLEEQQKKSQSYAHYLMGVIFDNQAQYHNAILEFKRVKQYKTDSENLYFRLASSYIHLKEYDKAQEALNDVLGLDSDNLKARFSISGFISR